ncbi:Flp family type IVb pilin [Massilia sp.]|uniref:Flp family type IVb pilin n=1 Tax=Massilia sp. TaxID=1882437 RepID=UPI00391C3777
MNTITSAIKTFIADEDGVTAIEYGLLAALVGVAIVAGATALGGGLDELFTDISDKLKSFA